MSHRPLMMRIAAMTHPGLIRSHNEDCIGVADWIRSAGMISPVLIQCSIDETRICVIADGLGGHSSGEVASMLTIREMVASAPGFDGPEAVVNALQRVNKRLYDVMLASPQFEGMGATIIGLATIGSNICVFNVGDSRAYMAVDGYLRLLSRDDSVDAAISDSSERTGQHTHGVTQSLGGLSSFQPVDPFLIQRAAKPGERYILCSDGLTDMLDLDAIEGLITEDPTVSVNQLIQAALDAGGVDNISVVIVDLCSWFL